MTTAFAIAVIIGVSAGTAWLGWLSLRSLSYAASPVERALDRHRSSLLALPGVCSVGIGKVAGVPCIVVFTTQLTEHESVAIPTRLDGWHVRRQTVDDPPVLMAEQTALP